MKTCAGASHCPTCWCGKFFHDLLETFETSRQETFPAAQVVSVGVHEEQLRPEVFFALRHVEVAARLEYMAEARGLPKPGKPHPDAEAQEALGGDRCDSDADFEREPALPGEGSQSEDEGGAVVGADPELQYTARWKVDDNDYDDIVHRRSDALEVTQARKRTHRKELMQVFMKYQEHHYSALRQGRCAVPRQASVRSHTCKDVTEAQNSQQRLLKDREKEELQQGGSPGSVAHAGAAGTDADASAAARALCPEELPKSPIDFALELIATSGVWKSQEQYLASLFVLQLAQDIWRSAMKTGKLEELGSSHTLAKLARAVQVRQLFLHGPGGSGKTYYMTEIVNTVILRFFGRRALKLVAAANSAARLLGGQNTALSVQADAGTVFGLQEVEAQFQGQKKIGSGMGISASPSRR